MWIIQDNIWKESKYNQMIEYLQRYNIDYKIINLIPFSESIDLPCDPEQVKMVFGSIRFTQLAQDKGVKVHFNDNFNFIVWSEVFKDNCLNHDSRTCTIEKLNLPLEHDVFIRPVLDDKSFTGTILQAGDTLSQIQFTTSKSINGIVIQVAPIKKIYREDRFFVVNGQIVTGSIYKSGTRIIYTNLDGITPNESWDFAQKMVDIWTPSNMFVIDIAETPDGFKIIEFGSIHNCGFYDIDLSKLIQTINK